MALTPERIKELQGYASGGQQSQPVSYNPPVAQLSTSSPFVQGIKDQYNATIKPIVNSVVGFGTGGAKTVPGLIGATANLASSFASKYLPENSGINNFLSNQAKNVQYYNDNAFTTGTLGKINDTTAGKIGQVGGTIAQYFMGLGELGAAAKGAEALSTAKKGFDLAKFAGTVGADTLIATGQTGNFTDGAKTGLISAVTGAAGPLINEVTKLVKGGTRLLTGAEKVAEVAKPKTLLDASKGYGANVLKGATQGYVADVTQNITEGKKGTGILTPGAGTLLGSVVGGVQGVKPLKGDLNEIRLKNTEKNIDKLVGSITQGKLEDITSAKNALLQFHPDELKDIKTFKDYETALNTKISDIEASSNKVLDKSPMVKKLDDLQVTKNIDTPLGPTTATSNHAKDAINQLEEYYTKTGNAEGKATMELYLKKANQEGLTAKDINEIAKIHGRDLNAYNANGELASGLSRQSAEQTRAGLKDTSREMSSNPKLLKAKDAIVSDLINTRNLATKMSQKVNTFEQSLTKLGISGNLKNNIKNIVYGVKFAIVKSIASLSPTQMEKLNPSQIEQKLNETLMDVKKVINSGKSENEIIKALDDISKKTYVALPTRESRPLLKSKPDASGIDVKGTQELTDKITKQSQDNTLRLPAGNKGNEAKKNNATTKLLPTSALKKNQEYVGNTQSGKISGKALLGTAAAGTGALLLKGKKDGEVKAETKPSPKLLTKSSTEQFPQPKDADKRKNGFINSENRGDAAKGNNLYKVVGVTGDIGKYQANPETIKNWSKAFLGKTYTPEEFKNNPDAQEKFMNEFLAVAENYKLTPEESAILWHKGWGKLGDAKSKADKEKAIRQQINSYKNDKEVQKYVNNFKIGYNK